ncbi:hypothetical protein CQS04_12150 [Chryseomicrobium excrementi]|uniref:Uncharacterized protein n=1 Tax=Chryseomicrobium excrementi TaxID=2041346 RepID=A0A2M9EXP4_9BACL|nr:hypothetical protein CQS04_12150 [Chryseomicrobium excrementi]
MWMRIGLFILGGIILGTLSGQILLSSRGGSESLLPFSIYFGVFTSLLICLILEVRAIREKIETKN